MYLVDTNVISVRAPGPIAAWMHAHSAELFLSVVTVAEIESGIAKSAREGATRKAADLRDWLALLLHLYAARVLIFDIATAEHAGGLSDFARAKGQAPGFADIVIAATARRHGLTILSRNIRHFAPLGVTVIDPFAALP